MRLDLRPIGIATFALAVALASCNGYGTNTGPGTNPTGVIPSPTPSGSPTIPPTATPPPSSTPTGSTTPSPAPSGANVLILFTGSFQFGPFTIQLYTNDVAIVTESTGQFNTTIPRSLAHPFWLDLHQNLPVNDIKIGSCPKPTAAPLDTTTLTYQNETSGDISCPGNHIKTKILYEDVLAIENYLDLRSKLRIRR